MASRLLFTLASRFFSLLLSGDITADCQPTMLTMKFQWFGRKCHQEHFARLLLHFEFKVTHTISVFHHCHGTFSIGRISIKSERNGASSDQLVARITRHLDETIVNFKNDAIGDSANDQSIRACLERLRESLLALT